MSHPISPATRRAFLRLLGAAGASALLAPAIAAAHPAGSGGSISDSHALPGGAIPQIKVGDETILILLFPGFTAIDAIGPEYIFSGMMGATVKFVAKTAAPVRAESGFEVSPAFTFENCPRKPTLLLVPGGTDGVLRALEDKDTLEFIRRIGGAADLAGSVCTGSILLGAAGLLDGYEATSHWQTRELLPLLGAKPVDKRVVFDRNRVTGAGVTAGLDLALELVRRFRDDFYAKGMQLLAEYDPQPPFAGGGDHRTADPRVVLLLNEMHRPFVTMMGETAQKHRLAP